jgi:hypothetical protein
MRQAIRLHLGTLCENVGKAWRLDNGHGIDKVNNVTVSVEREASYSQPAVGSLRNPTSPEKVIGISAYRNMPCRLLSRFQQPHRQKPSLLNRPKGFYPNRKKRPMSSIRFLQ